MLHSSDPSIKAPYRRRGAREAAAAFGLATVLLTACTGGDAEKSAESSSSASTTAAAVPLHVMEGPRAKARATDAGLIDSGIAVEKQVIAERAEAHEKQQALNAAVEQVLATTFHDLPERLSAFKDVSPMTFHQDQFEELVDPSGEPWKQILSQTCGSIGCQSVFPFYDEIPAGSTEPYYSFHTTYGENPDGSRVFQSVSLSVSDSANPETMNDPELKGQRSLKRVGLLKNDEGNWDVNYEDLAAGISTLGYSTGATEPTRPTPAGLREQVEYFYQLLGN